MKTLKYLFLTIISLAMLPISVACIEDEISTSPSDQPHFNVDTLRFGPQYSDEVTPTQMLMVYNHHDKVISISDISFQNDGAGVFRLNVDGQAGTRFSGVEVRPNDSIYVLISARFPENGSYTPVEVIDKLSFTTNGVTQTVVVTAESHDVLRLTDPIIDADTRWDAATPRRIYGTLTIAPGATLTLDAGTTLYLHDKAAIQVDGTLITEGTPDDPVILRGDRLDSVVGEISFDLMSGQWGGVRFSPSSTGSSLAFTEIRNTSYGVIADTTTLTLSACRLRNSAATVLSASHSDITAVSTEFAEAAAGAVSLFGGNAQFSNCTFSNYYLFSAITGPLVTLLHTGADKEEPDPSSWPLLKARFDNSILYGSSAEMNLKDLTGTDIILTNCILRSNGTNDDNFIDCLWNTDPLFNTIRADYIFDYSLQPNSPAAAASIQIAPTNPNNSGSLTPLPLPQTDFYGTPRPTPAAIGAYEPKPLQ